MLTDFLNYSLPMTAAIFPLSFGVHTGNSIAISGLVHGFCTKVLVTCEISQGESQPRNVTETKANGAFAERGESHRVVTRGGKHLGVCESPLFFSSEPSRAVSRVKSTEQRDAGVRPPC